LRQIASTLATLGSGVDVAEKIKRVPSRLLTPGRRRRCGTPITPADIGFGITAKDVTGANVVSARGLDAITKIRLHHHTFGSLT